MNINDIVREVKKWHSTASIVEIVDGIESFLLIHSINGHWNFEYSINLYYSGSATSTATILTDSSAAFAVDGSLIGQTIINVTDGSSGTITAATATTITATLSGGTSDTWTSADEYTISIVNNIRLPKSINVILSLWVGTTWIPTTLRYDGFKNTTGQAYDPYSENIYFQAPDGQACLILQDYVMKFVNDLGVTAPLKIRCEKTITSEVSEDDLTTELSLPDKLKLATAYYVLYQLYGSDKYDNENKSYKFNQKYESAYMDASDGVNSPADNRLNHGIKFGKHNFQSKGVF